MKHNKSDLWNLNQKLERQNALLLNQCETLETIRKVEHLTASNFESFLLKNYYRLFFLSGQIYMPIGLGVGIKVKSSGKFLKQA